MPNTEEVEKIEQANAALLHADAEALADYWFDRTIWPSSPE